MRIVAIHATNSLGKITLRTNLKKTSGDIITLTSSYQNTKALAIIPTRCCRNIDVLDNILAIISMNYHWKHA